MSSHEITPELIERWALVYLGRYASSAENLRRVLIRHARRRTDDRNALAASAAAIETLVTRYLAVGFLDDAGYAAGHARSLHRRGRSLAAIRARLAAKGVAAEAATGALAALAEAAADPDLAAAGAFARRRRLGPYRRAAAERERELAAFARAGFTRAIAEAVLACSDIAQLEDLVSNGR